MYAGKEEAIAIVKTFAEDIHMENAGASEVVEALIAARDTPTEKAAQCEKTERVIRCIHCDPTFVPTGPDDWCYCICHEKDDEF